MKASEYIVQDNDTVQKIAASELGNPSRWLEIVTFNKLTYPFISNTPFVDTYASGDVTFKRTTTTLILTLPIGTIVKTSPPEGSGTEAKVYKTTAVVTFGIGEDTKSVNVECTEIGNLGNTPAYSINTIQDSPQSDLIVENSIAFNNGNTYNVKVAGDKILIPQEISTENHTASELLTIEEFDKQILGQDLFLNIDGELEISTSGDYKTLSGLDLYKQQIIHRLVTRKGYYTYHPDYGSNLYLYLGGGITEYTLQAVKREVIRVIQNDPRTYKVNEETMKVYKLAGETAVRIEVEAEIIGRKNLAKIQFNI